MSSSGLEASEQEMQEALDGIDGSDQDSTMLG
ncbi:hypothetical protein PC116_g31078 [Phytophthora cactorum]|nr:hypothetical protein PC116_g31078 [Phytophthora cactorum]